MTSSDNFDDSNVLSIQTGMQQSMVKHKRLAASKVKVIANIFKRKRRRYYRLNCRQIFVIFQLILTLHLNIFVMYSQAMFFHTIKQIWEKGSSGIGITFISNPYNFNDHYNVCMETCRMSMSCWVSGGIKVSGNCESIFQVCCKNSIENDLLHHHIAEARKINNWDEIVVNDVDAGGGSHMKHPPFLDVHYGPVINEPECGKRRISRRRVVGGRSAGFGTYPWQVGVYSKKNICEFLVKCTEHN